MSDDRSVRPAEVADAAELLAIYAPFVTETAISYELEPPTVTEFAARIERTLATDPWLVAYRGGRIVGYTYSSPFRSRAAYSTTRESTVYVPPDHHRSGVGRQLLTALLHELADRGVRTVVAVIGLPNDGSIALHEALGYRPVGVINQVARKFERWHDEGFWQCHLDPPPG